jgi:hypothetical protein
MPRPEVKLAAEHRRALELLAGCCPGGCAEALMIALGFTRELLSDLIRGGLARADTEHMVEGGKLVDVRRYRITAAGWRARK